MADLMVVFTEDQQDTIKNVLMDAVILYRDGPHGYTEDEATVAIELIEELRPKFLGQVDL